MITIRRHPNSASFFLATIILSFLLKTRITLATPAMASSKGNKEGGSGGGGGGWPVSQERVSTGNSNLDKQINKVYSCISKTHQGPPTIVKLDSQHHH